ncbi:MAG: metallophosphoesterase [Chloroflexi bacterium]|nr:metallophosphoesterase [Chloroflexota bacterium]
MTRFRILLLVAALAVVSLAVTPILANDYIPSAPRSLSLALEARSAQLYLPLLSNSIGSSRPIATPGATHTPPAGDPVLVGAGDMRNCNTGLQETAALIKTIPGTVIMLGDSTATGAPSQYPCYDAAWGQFKNRTIPVIGNHEYLTSGASGYFAYFGAAAHGPGAYFSTDVGSWHIIILNSNCSQVGGCQAGSAQEKWLRADLTAHQGQCTLALWHHPRFNSGKQGDTIAVTPFWQDLYNAGVHLVLNGHEHNYERFARQNPNGVADPKGIREFIVGTGGAGGGSWVAAQPNSEVHAVSVFGAIKLTLHASSYDWQFIPVPGMSFTDSGSESCH